LKIQYQIEVKVELTHYLISFEININKFRVNSDDKKKTILDLIKTQEEDFEE